MARRKVVVEFEVSGPDAYSAGDAFDSALDAGSIQGAVEDACESLGINFTIESATVVDGSRAVGHEPVREVMVGRAANGRDGVGSGYDAQVIYRGHGDAMIALYSVRTREWVAIGTVSIGKRPEDRDQAALNRLARELASNPGSFGDELVWYERDPQTFDELADEFDELEKQYRSRARA